MDEEIQHTHKAIMTIYSDGPSNMVCVKIQWDPDIEGKQIEELGYIPAAYNLIQEFMLPALEEAYLSYENAKLMESSSHSTRRH